MDIAGINHKYKKLKRTPAKCFLCGEFSECQITKYEKSSHIFFFNIKVLDEQFLFDWKKCNHRAVLSDQQDIDRYKREQVDTGILSVPSLHNMKFQLMDKPKVKNYQIVLVIIFSLILGGFLSFLLDYFGVPFIP